MTNSAETELKHLKTAVRYLIGLLEEGSLVPRYDEATRKEIGLVLQHLLHKVEGLPEGVPENLVQGTAVRALDQIFGLNSWPSTGTVGASYRFCDGISNIL